MKEVINKSIFKHKDVWFPDENSDYTKDCDVCCVIGSKNKIQNAISSKLFHSLISNLNCELEQLDCNFEWSTKYDIRRSERDELDIKQYSSEDLLKNDNLLKSFELVYNEMYKMKGLDTIANIESIVALAKINGVMLSCAKNDGMPLVYHVYVIDEKHARLWMSASVFRESEDKQFRAKVGRANKRLHYEDIKFFHAKSYESYDWGGILSFEEPNGIDKFKMSFGGERIDYYDETIICSNKYRFFYKFKKLLKK